ncbi:MAG: hypothetical protein H6581_05880 [Bacteroidia bacterium]|nr:hypothetical protein [Bacteroidia bacterium]
MRRLKQLTYLVLTCALILLAGCQQQGEDPVSHHPNDQPDDMIFVLSSPGFAVHLDTETGPSTLSKKFDLDNNGSNDLLFSLSFAPDTCAQDTSFSFKTEITSLKANTFLAAQYPSGASLLQLEYGDTISIAQLNSDPLPADTSINDHWVSGSILFENDCSAGTYISQFANEEYLPVKYIQNDGNHLAWIQISQLQPQIVSQSPLRMTFDLEIRGWAYNRAHDNDIFAGQIRK